MTIHCIFKVANTYRTDKNIKHTFKEEGAVAYDGRIISYNFDKQLVSIWTIKGRLKIPIAFGQRQKELLKFQKGESDLCLVNNSFYLNATCDIKEETEREFNEILGVDLGINKIASTSKDKHYQGKELAEHRLKRQNIRRSLGKKTKNAKRNTRRNIHKAIKRIGKKESRYQKWQNHNISKDIIDQAIMYNYAIALEELKGIRDNTNKKIKRKGEKSKKVRRVFNNWAFYQLKQFIKYKAQKAGVKVIEVPAYYTSQTCKECLHIGQRSGEKFSCRNCGYTADADYNGACIISMVGAVVNQPENPNILCCSLYN